MFEVRMLLSRRTYAKILPEYSNIIVHMCYATSKLWNVCNYERRHYKELGREKYPDWYYQKKEDIIYDYKSIMGIRKLKIKGRKRCLNFKTSK